MAKLEIIWAQTQLNCGEIDVNKLCSATRTRLTTLYKGLKIKMTDLDCARDGDVPYRLPHALPLMRQAAVVVVVVVVVAVAVAAGIALVQGAQDGELEPDYLRHAGLQSHAAAAVHRIWDWDVPLDRKSIFYKVSNLLVDCIGMSLILIVQLSALF